MKISYLDRYAVTALLLLAGCVSRQEAKRVPKLGSEVGHLN
ncbi:hypothetical protein [Sodalis-like endosymbiont of Proechinophthirus fluctus]|nr:hypothetical protein [Sodalis-like endosymbiont of Proechinophthirus fluctus]